MNKSRPARVLLADDNPVNRRMTLRMLAKMGIEADVAENGSQAVEKARSRSYDLILMDVQMPVMDGLEATRELRRSGITLPIVAMTASAVESDKERCLEAGMTDYVCKPIERRAMKAILNTFCHIDGILDSPDRPSILEADDGPAVSQKPFSGAGTATGQKAAPDDRFLDRAAKELGMLPEEYLDLAEEFIGDVDQRLNGIETGLSDNDSERVRQIAHAIKGGASDMLLEDMAAAAARIELRAKEGALSGCGDDVDSLRSTLDRFRRNTLGAKSDLGEIE